MDFTPVAMATIWHLCLQMATWNAFLFGKGVWQEGAVILFSVYGFVSLYLLWPSDANTDLLTILQLGSIFNETGIQMQPFSSRIYSWKCCLQNGGDFASAPIPGNKFQGSFSRNTKLFFDENAFENVPYKKAAILPRPQCVNIMT